MRTWLRIRGVQGVVKKVFEGKNGTNNSVGKDTIMGDNQMEKEEMENYVKAGRILQSAKKKAQQLVKPGASLLEVAEKVEGFIESEGGKPAFPINLSLNNCAAHYTPSSNDESVFSGKDVVKADIGVHIEGYAADSAITIDLSGEFGKMLEASNNALEAALR